MMTSIRSPSLGGASHSRCGSMRPLSGSGDPQGLSIPPPPPSSSMGFDAHKLSAPGSYAGAPPLPAFTVSLRANSVAGNYSPSGSPFTSQLSSDMMYRLPPPRQQQSFNLLVNPQQDDQDATTSAASAVGDESKNSKARGQQRKRFFKTRLCPYHFKKGSACKGGIHCSYAHSFSELRPSVDLTKTKLCHDYLSGLCNRKADECPFAHGSTELRPVRPTTEAGGSGTILNLPDNPYGRCATSTDLWEVSRAPGPIDRAHTFETHGGSLGGRQTGVAGGYGPGELTSAQSSLIDTYPSANNVMENFTPSPATPVSSKYLSSPSPKLESLLASRSTDTALSTQPSGSSTRQGGLVPLSDQQASRLLATLSSPSPSDFIEDDSGARFNNKATDSSEQPCLDIATGSSRPNPEPSKLDWFGRSQPESDDEPKLTLTVSQLANIILAAHAAESPADLVTDVLSYIYKA
eukprot:Protomagalhaensia_sp_Gyna_25__5242@NODE_639_length_2934_cov_218_730570_g498_i0_p1_GENE_NODE_639_length_2934_cov_218_730570_g498_i0NODE_639_length_2934_cov_218_730570_g498_i0_p1_ORF_typecomplete_len476_score34_72zfCCCH/PF00642_24/0_031zfCCCH/PF00642_24/0_00023zfCCCH_3/PF15663_5/6_3e06Torus/PF16131_5/0_00092Torus/PF16131_5/2_4_NODE_639_length_2934_cov_218_730570_g498_i0421430